MIFLKKRTIKENRVVNVEGVQESNFVNTEDSHGSRSKGINENNLSK